MSSSLFLGTYPGLTQVMLEQEIKVIADFLLVQKKSSSVGSSMAPAF
jgi:hypothetical protein